jgi:hypothetical protein
MRQRRFPKLRSRAGIDGAIGFIFAIPFWWALYGVMFVFAYWMWSMAFASVGTQVGTHAEGIHEGSGQYTHKTITANGIRGFAEPYMGALRLERGDRTVRGRLDVAVTNTAFPSPRTVEVHASAVARDERFYAWYVSGRE